MKFSLLNYRELNECRRTIENIDLDNIQSSDIDAIYKIAFHYLTTYHYCGRQKRHLTKAKQYFELPYVLNNDYLHITSLNIYKTPKPELFTGSCLFLLGTVLRALCICETKIFPILQMRELTLEILL